jgi:anti-sigma-K factor RskA
MSDERMEGCEVVELYALGALQEDEMERFSVHLKDCSECQKLVKEYREVIDVLPLASEPVEPPSGLKKRILSQVLESEGIVHSKPDTGSEVIKELPVEREREIIVKTTPAPKRLPVWRYISLGLAAAVVILLAYTGQLRQDVNRLQEQIVASTEPLQGLKVNESVALNPSAENSTAEGLATIIADRSGTHLVVQAKNLPELKGTEVYQVWLIKGEATQNAGTFVSQDGNGALYYSFESKAYDTVAITLEPDNGGETPRGQIVLAAPIKKG